MSAKPGVHQETWARDSRASDGHMAKPTSVVLYLGGGPTACTSPYLGWLRIVQHCAERGWSTHVVWTDMPTDPDLAKPFLDAGCEINLLPRPGRNFDVRCVLRTHRLLRRVMCDVFHCLNIHTSPLVAAALAAVPVRIWSKWAMSSCYERNETPRGVHRLHPSTRLSCALAHRILPISTAVRDELARAGASPSKLTVVPGPIGLVRYSDASANGIRSELSISDSDPVITTVGHSVPVKGWDVLIRAFAAIVAKHDRVQLLLVGSNAEPHETETARELKDLAAKLRIERAVHFLGRRSDIPEILAASDLFVLPSRSEGQPFALKEALAAGLPCIAARVGGIPELITHRRHGLLFDREDVTGLADMLIELLQDKSLGRCLGTNGRKRVQQFGLDKMTERMVDLYEKLLANAKLADGCGQK